MTKSMRDLIAELAQVEDAIRRVSLDAETSPVGVPSRTGVRGAGINPQLIALAAQEAEIVALLHAMGHPRADDDHDGAGGNRNRPASA